MENPLSLLLLLLFFFLVYVLRALYRAYASPFRDIPGPWLARFTRLWLLKAVGSGSFEKLNIALHREYGKLSTARYHIITPDETIRSHRSPCSQRVQHR